MSRKIIGIGLVLLGLIAGVVMVMSNDGRVAQNPSVPSSIISTSEIPESPASRTQPVSIEVVAVSSQYLEEAIPLSGELLPFLSVDLSPKITGIVESVSVDRGATVKKGDILIQLRAPELQAQRREAEAQLRAANITYTRLQAAASTPGVVAGNDVELAQHHQEALTARLESLQEMEKYLRVKAPFDGVITQRNIHPGAMVGPDGVSGRTSSLLRLEQIVHLRLIVPVPEAYAGSIDKRATVPFTVPAYPEETFRGVVSRIAQSVDPKTRSMPVEMDVDNQARRLAAGMFSEVRWPIRRSRPTLFVPATAVVTTTENVFVLLVKENLVEWIPVRKGSKSGSMVEVFGALQSGDLVMFRGTDEIRPGTEIIPVLKEVPPNTST
ncbi:efflux RND transporter periplasmic adaptor subunit [Candidatus Nitrospira neomarina]|uniref:Efflux RND transporter periplasmic adaptor subunit n=1 Tax=Candidatus Nitrospira neomarina TaxID=3020899 RepID=A0AA96GHK8_9BACT|nr:efflux RND transporter periplasmic adaptor subunit [Candidatus Nitrospira neomarina]WNM62544.1 efflux RND transporter periplasmic adaptor subunit [Candidatus Nitrospira neomarina]